VWEANVRETMRVRSEENDFRQEGNEKWDGGTLYVTFRLSLFQTEWRSMEGERRGGTSDPSELFSLFPNYVIFMPSFLRPIK